MLTKIVYVVVATENSIYLEQAYASIWSLKYHNPNAIIALVMDDKTAAIYNENKYTELSQLVSEIVVVPLSNEMDNHTRSRWLKTNLRNLIHGNYLFLDTDTIISSNISEIDNFSGTIGAVVDGHRYIDKYPIYPFVIKWMKKYFSNIPILPTINYYNSGVMLVKDCPQAYNFYDLWHKNWEKSKLKGFKFDQLPLFATDNELNGIISPINDIFNYQVSETVKYLHSSKILHFYNGENAETLHPYFGKIWLQEIKINRQLSDKTKNEILNCKNLFNLKSKIIGGNNVDVWKSHVVKFLQIHQKNKYLYFLVNMTARGINYITKILN